MEAALKALAEPNRRRILTLVRDEELTAGAVIVASGGFGANPEYLAEHYPIAWKPGETFYIGAEGAKGDHLKFADQVGAQLTGENRGLRMLNPVWTRCTRHSCPAGPSCWTSGDTGSATRLRRTASSTVS